MKCAYAVSIQKCHTKDNNMGNEFGNRLKNARNSARLTQRQLAESIGVRQKQYQHWERGRAEPSIDNIQRLAFVLGIKVEWLIYGENGKFIPTEERTTKLLRRIRLFLHDNPQAFHVTQKMFELLVSSYKSLKEK